jgi:hypothetical protein
MLTAMEVGGTVDRRFAPVRDAFETVLASQRGTGAAVAAWCDGTWVVDLWGGAADAAGTRPVADRQRRAAVLGDEALCRRLRVAAG